MARGMANNEPTVSQASTDEYRAGHERTFGERKPGQRGRWVWDERAGRLVRAEDYVPPESKHGAGIMVDRFMEGDRAPDGTDIGSRQKRKRWMAEAGVADYGDYAGARAKKRAEVDARRRGELKPDKELRDTIGRQLYKHKVIL